MPSYPVGLPSIGGKTLYSGILFIIIAHGSAEIKNMIESPCFIRPEITALADFYEAI